MRAGLGQCANQTVLPLLQSICFRLPVFSELIIQWKRRPLLLIWLWMDTKEEETPVTNMIVGEYNGRGGPYY